MPTSPATICRDCSKRALIGTSYCGEHQIENAAAEYKALYQQNKSDDPLNKLYRCRRWTKGTRFIVLRRDPLCVICGHKASHSVDHHPLNARDIVAQFGINEFYNA